MTASYQLLQGDCLEVLRGLEPGSVQTCVTSPPYFGLRSYLPDGHPDKHMEIGTEQTPEEFIVRLVEVFREVRRVLRDDGTLWLNLGDSYAGSGGAGDWSKRKAGKQEYAGPVGNNANRFYQNFGLKSKDLIGIPWMAAFALRADGWWLRSDIIWSKRNPMPESVTDRPTKSHEYIFLLSKSESYFYDAEAIKEPSVTGDMRRPYGSQGAWDMDGRPEEQRHGGELRSSRDSFKREGSKRQMAIPGQSVGTHRPDREESEWDTAKRNKRSVWSVATTPYAGAHFATFPPELIEPCILASTSAYGCCVTCGAPWKRVTEHADGDNEACDRPKKTAGMNSKTSTLSLSGNGSKEWAERGAKYRTLGWQPTCDCEADGASPCIVLDPFNGSGTTGEVALKNGRSYIGIDLNSDYLELSRQRLQRVQMPLLVVA